MKLFNDGVILMCKRKKQSKLKEKIVFLFNDGLILMCKRKKQSKLKENFVLLIKVKSIIDEI